MELNSRQRAYLRSMCNTMPAILYIGKEGVTENTCIEAEKALEARELIKCSLQKGAPMSAREACEALALECRAEQIQSIGSKCVLYKRNETDPRIELPKSKKK